MKRSTILISLALLTTASITFPAHATPLFTIIHPTAPTYRYLDINGVSGDGRYLIGNLYDNIPLRATRWTIDSAAVTDLGLISGRPYSRGIALSYDGSQAAAEGISAGTYQPQSFHWSESGTKTTLPFPPTTSFAYSTDISSDGSIVLGWTNTTNNTAIWRWSAANGTTFEDPGPTGHDIQSTRSLSGNGRYSVFGPYRHDSLTNTTLDIGRLTDANGLPSYSPSLLSISHDGSTAIGTIRELALGGGGYSGTVGIIWTQSAGLQTLFPPSPSHNYLPRFLSADGSTVLGTDNGYPFLWTRDLGQVDFLTYLESLGIDTSDINYLNFGGISDNGKVIAGVYSTDANQRVGFALSLPIPEPTTPLLPTLLTPLLLSRIFRRTTR